MKRIQFKELVGRVIEEVLVSKDETRIGKFVDHKVYLRVKECPLLYFDLIDPEESDSFEVCPPEPRVCVASVSSSVVGCKVSDVIASDLMSNVGLLLNNGSVLTNDIGEFGNSVEVLDAPEFVRLGDFVSLVKH